MKPRYRIFSDEFYFYDPDCGMMDVSYACAWQLGRMVSMNHLTVCRELVSWRLDHCSEAAKNFQQSQLLDRIPAEGKDVGEQLINACESVLEMLKEASLFYHVPAAYLFPVPDMLKKDSLNFFQVDHNWVLAMLDGICSVGRNASIDYSHDTELIVDIYRQALRENEQVRLKLQDREYMDTGEQVPEVISGFLLNSVLTENFRGLEFRAYDQREGGEPLKALRIETVRDIEEGKLGGRQAELVLKSKENRVIDVKASAARLEEAAGLQNMTSAEFALEMIQNAQTGVFTMEEELK